MEMLENFTQCHLFFFLYQIDVAIILKLLPISL